jgi:DNA-binding SARP family transcriptional activator
MGACHGRVELRLLGGFEVRCDGLPVELPPTLHRLLALLALRDRSLLRSYVAGVLWPDTTEDKAHANLRTALWRLHHDDLGLATATPTHLGIGSDVWVDVRAAQDAARLIDAGDRTALDTDPGLFGGELLPGLWDSWLVMERERVRQISLHALERLSAALTDAGQHGRAVLAALLAVDADPLRESANRTLMGAHLAESNRSEALAQLRRYRALLAEELGIEPSPSLQAMVGLSHA